MASEAKILEAIFGPSIPTEKAAVLPAIMGHIKAIEDLLQGVPRRQAHPRITDPAISGPINSRIVEICAEHGGSWPKIAAAICQEFGVQISSEACRGRYKDAMERKTAAIMQREGYVALSGEAIQAGVYTTPLNVSQAAAKDEPADPIADRKRGQQVAQDSSPKEPAPLTEAEIDSELIRLRDTGMSPKEIRDAMLHRGVDFGLVELKDRLSALARKAMQDRKDARQAIEPEIPANCNRAELDAVMWRLWDHGQGKTPDEISDILCNNGYSYGTVAVERRLRQQGGEL